MTDTTDAAVAAQVQYIRSTSETSEALDAARADAEEFGLTIPDEVTGQLVTTLAAAGAASGSSGAVAITPAAGVVGLYMLEGLGERQNVTCIDSEAERQQHAKSLFRTAGYSPSRARFLPSRPLDVLSRLANDAYHLVYLDVSPLDMPAALKAAVGLLTVGGTLVMADSLLDGTVADTTRTDPDTRGAREADAEARALENCITTRLPLGAGVTLVTRTA
ncbi:methyltransferase [Corynebacterium yudongzhengii]|uniref:Methyltransferase n=1 Tax=Corynebacterium yudongzhengii TaxID=2080740 RepID=A0A2U1T9I9_9CORY|nr:methyltransferase [Corynebacterium yudongzhengii]AWB82994.1 methyltransferase [Corynebacterium yudongzhengii]PWC02676.1 methyltransferase [Corynebacterium yudongzhengii]